MLRFQFEAQSSRLIVLTNFLSYFHLTELGDVKFNGKCQVATEVVDANVSCVCEFNAGTLLRILLNSRVLVAIINLITLFTFSVTKVHEFSVI